ncbi:glutamate receptor ionotropic, kainate 3-like [Ixodes scapularis]|uniref:glutamate receptor ionotropic, kainate 3-like n=1 Tax=Ixodes scapularis TaxID=6945 RepID=UPI001A9DEED2|nr:glutamate receptor ionotropic, kainate 3-like [Ixodes scapularis]
MKYAFRPPGKVRLVQCCAERQSYDSIILELKAKHELRVMLDLTPSEVDRFMTKAMKQSMDSRYHQYIITSMDVHTVNVASWWPKNGTGAGKRPGVYGLRILDPSDGAVRGVIRDWNFGELLFGRRVDQRTLRTMNALIYDAVALLSRSFHDLDTSQAIETLNISCSITNPQAFWPYGGSLVSYMKMVQVKGLTGDVRLNERGARRDLVLDVVKIRENAFAKEASTLLSSERR